MTARSHPEYEDLVETYFRVPRAFSTPRGRARGRDLIDLYLFLPMTVGIRGQAVRFRSSFEALLTDTRSTVGRSTQTGEIENLDGSRGWIGAMGYLALIDQLGLNLSPVGARPAETPFERLLLWDAQLLPAEAAALYALRCAMVHK